MLIKKGRVFGKIFAPPSKSYTHRALILAGLTKGESKIFNPLICDDTKATISCLKKIGIKIKKEDNFLKIKGGNFSTPKTPLFCRESGTTFRFLSAICALIKGKCYLTGKESLLKRPILPLLKALKNLGVKCQKKGKYVILENNFLGGKTKIRGNISSQFISGLLLISPFCKKEVEIILTTPLESKPYLLMTIEMQKKFGVKVEYKKNLRWFRIKRQNYKATDYFVEGDWSSVSPFLVAGALTGKIKVKNLNFKSCQADRKIIEVLKKANVNFKIEKDFILVEKSKIKSFKFNVKDCPDLFPIICVLGVGASGKTEISGIERLKYKESNRLREMEKNLKKMKIFVKRKKGKFLIEGGEPQGIEIDTKDHRIAMAFSILGLISKGKTKIKNPNCVKKSYPEFFKILKNLIF